MKSITAIILLALALIGCSTSHEAKTSSTEQPPKHMGRVQFVAYDSVTRPMTASVEVFETPPARRHKQIALITCEGAYHEEAVMTKAILFKARQLGADAIVRNDANTVQTGGGGMYRGTGGGKLGGRSLFHASAIVWEKE